MTLKDIYGNLITTPNIFTASDMDGFIIGPVASLTAPSTTTYLRSIDTSNSASGIYLFPYTVYKVGTYELYIRLKG